MRDIPLYSVDIASCDRAKALDAGNAVLAPWSALAGKARVPEHSVPFMAGMSGGAPLVLNGYLFFTGEDWITCVGYPLEGGYDAAAFIAAADLLGDHLLAGKEGSLDMFAVAPHLPAGAVRGLGGEIGEEDALYCLPATAQVPAPLRRVVQKAGEALRVDETKDFSGAHRRLWSEMLARPGMRANVRALYAKSPRLMEQKIPDIFFLNAWDAAGNLAASLLIDASPAKFCSYIIGGHSRRGCAPHATDLLFAALLEKARALGKAYVHLGLGVNAGILRFKQKWGGQRDLPFVMASWKHSRAPGKGKGRVREGMDDFVTHFRKAAAAGKSKQQIFDALPRQRPLAMLWRLEKNGKTSWIAGTAHFSYYSFTRHFETLFERVDSVLFEGPMDDESMAFFTASGKARRSGDPDILSLLSGEELARLRRMAEGPEHPFLRRLLAEGLRRVDVARYLAEYRPWYAFFAIWAAFLERQGWTRSVDLEAWNLAHERGKIVIAMETREEQMASLESVPAERIVRFFRQSRRWPAFSRKNLNSYLLGDLGGMYGTSTEFPTRGVSGVFNRRDRRFTERMLPFVEQGRSLTFVGAAHLLAMRDLLRDAGVSVTKEFPGPLHRLKCRVYKRIHGEEADFA